MTDKTNPLVGIISTDEEGVYRGKNAARILSLVGKDDCWTQAWEERSSGPIAYIRTE